MKKENKGFTLSEVLVAIVVIGIVMALSVQTIKIIQTSYTPLAYFSYKNMRSIVYLLFSTNMSATTTISCIDTHGNETKVLIPDGYTSSGTAIPYCNALGNGSGSSTVCNAIAKDIVNVKGGFQDCSNFSPVASSADSDGQPKFSSLSNPTFTATNGQQYYISRSMAPLTGMDYGYRLIAIDLNGKRKPNLLDTTTISSDGYRQWSSNRLPPDIVTFMMLDNGDIYPLGVAADNYKDAKGRHLNYIASSVKGYCFPRFATGANTPTFTHCPLTNSSIDNKDVPTECFIKRPNGTQGNICYYKIERPSNILSYRNAFCTTAARISFGAYCYNGSTIKAGMPEFRAVCPPYKSSDKGFDSCNVENIKPMFRFNFN